MNGYCFCNVLHFSVYPVAYVKHILGRTLIGFVMEHPSPHHAHHHAFAVPFVQFQEANGGVLAIRLLLWLQVTETNESRYIVVVEIEGLL